MKIFSDGAVSLASQQWIYNNDRFPGVAVHYKTDIRRPLRRYYGLDDRGSRARVPAGAGFSLHHPIQTGCGAHPASYPIGDSFPVPRREADHSPPSIAEVKNAWSYTSTPP